MYDFDALFKEFGIEFKSSEQVEVFNAIGYDGSIIVFNKADFFDTIETSCDYSLETSKELLVNNIKISNTEFTCKFISVTDSCNLKNLNYHKEDVKTSVVYLNDSLCNLNKNHNISNLVAA